MVATTVGWRQYCLLVIFSRMVDSVVNVHRGHYPYVYCQVSDVVLRTSDRSFYYAFDSNFEKCSGVKDIWPLVHYGNEALDYTATCSEMFDVGHVFTVYYFYGSNYFHLHYDMLIPLYVAVHHDNDEKLRQAFLPTVETRRLQVMEWNTPAFKDANSYWNQIIKTPSALDGDHRGDGFCNSSLHGSTQKNVIAGSYVLYPLDDELAQLNRSICFRSVRFGTPWVDFADHDLIRKFVQFIKTSLDVKESSTDLSQRVGLISRSSRRRILNEAELLAAVNAVVPTDRIDFTGMTFYEQVELMQHYTVLIGMNGAGLTNGLYLPPGGVAIQLVPSGIELNNRQFGELLRGGSGGQYLEWINTHENATINNQGDTFVDVDEVVDLVREALRLFDAHSKSQKVRNEL